MFATLTSLPAAEFELCEEIERVRARMVQLGNQYGLLHPEVQRCSEYLDGLVIQYYRLEKIKKAKAVVLEECAQ